jgi:DDE superfamily endonuclease
VHEVAAWRRPRLIARGDPDRDQILADLHQHIGDLPPGSVLLAEDETHLNLLPWVRATWIAKGTRTAPLVAVVCDNVIIHRSKIVQRWRKTHPRLLVLHGARYSPHDNPVERVWGALKAWLANKPTLTIQGRVRQAHAFFRQRTTAQMLATAAPHSSPWLPAEYVQNFRQAA